MDPPFLQDELVIEAKFTLRCTGQVCSHHDLTIYVCSENGTCYQHWLVIRGIGDSPSLLISKLTVSMTSTKASFLRYLTSLRLHDVAPVACIVILDESSRFR